MYDLEKIIIIGDFNYRDKENLYTTVMKTNGLKIESVLYLCDMGTITTDDTEVKNEIISELYEDQYDLDDLKIKVKEVFNGEDAIMKIGNFINKIWNEDTLVYFYNAQDEVFERLEKYLEKKNGRIYLTDYYDLFTNYDSDEKNIYTIMEEQGLKTENLYKDSQVQLVYFLGALVEKLLSK